jgi:hypothetical protein
MVARANPFFLANPLEGVGEFQNFVNQRIKENLFVFI